MTELDDVITATMAELASKRQELVNERERLREKVKTLDGQVAKADRILRASGMIEKQPAPKRARRSQLGEDKLSMVLGVIERSPDGITRLEISERLGLSAPSVGTGLAELRERGAIRKAGRREPAGTGGQGAEIFKVMANGN